MNNTETTDPRAIGEAVRRLRQRQGLSAERLAYQAHVSRSTVLTVENGKFTGRPYSLPAICEALGVTVGELEDIATKPDSIAKTPSAPTDGYEGPERRLTRYDKARERVRNSDVPRSEKERLLSFIDRLEVQQGVLDESLDATVDGIG